MITIDAFYKAAFTYFSTITVRSLVFTMIGSSPTTLLFTSVSFIEFKEVNNSSMVSRCYNKTLIIMQHNLSITDPRSYFMD
jgi:hypothetical protein